MIILRKTLAFAAMSLVFGSLGMSACNGPMTAARTPAEQTAQRSPAGLSLVDVAVTLHSGKTVTFKTEVAKSPEEQARGMMFRTELAPDAAMLFPMQPERMASFWMKNTVIPLDIIFIRKNGTIESIAANTTPYSLAPIASGEPVAAVFEIAGGRAAELGIQPGDKVRW